MKAKLLVTLCAVACSAATAFADAALRAGDTFDLRIGGVPADEMGVITGNYTIDGDGFMNISYLSKLRVGGMTASQIQSLVERSYVDRGIFTHPTVVITVNPGARFVNVGGSGMKGESRVPYTPDMTLLTAITAGGGLNDYADPKRVRLLRSGQVQVINCNEIRRNPEKDIKLLPGDIIQVPQSLF